MIGVWPQRDTMEGLKTLEFGVQEDEPRLGELNLGKREKYGHWLPSCLQASHTAHYGRFWHSAHFGTLPVVPSQEPTWSSKAPLGQEFHGWRLLPILLPLLHMMALKGLGRS